MKTNDRNDKKMDDSCLKLENQLCFPLYACAKEVVRRYHPLLEPFDLTYTQYIAMMVLWEKQEINVKELGNRLYLDSGTLTPLLKKLEAKGYLIRQRSKDDERNLSIQVTEAGMQLKEEILSVPEAMASCIQIDPEEAKDLYRLLYKVLDIIHPEK